MRCIIELGLFVDDLPSRGSRGWDHQRRLCSKAKAPYSLRTDQIPLISTPQLGETATTPPQLGDSAFRPVTAVLDLTDRVVFFRWMTKSWMSTRCAASSL